jgi:hypothetical protein
MADEDARSEDKYHGGGDVSGSKKHEDDQFDYSSQYSGGRGWGGAWGRGSSLVQSSRRLATS